MAHVCAIKGIWVSNQKRWDRSGAERLRLWKKSRVEVELELESDGSGEDGWRVQSLQAIAFSLLGLKESDRERNELWREQNSYIHRIAEWLESGLGPEEIEVQVVDSTMRV